MKTTTTADHHPRNPSSAQTPTDGSAGMPLAARRLVLVGGLCIPVGLVAGPYLLGLQLLAVAGVVAVAVALSYRSGPVWFSRWSWLTAAAGTFWVSVTIAYWLTIVAAADATAAPSGWTPVLFNVGACAVALMAVGTAAGVIARYRSGRASAAPVV